jgi:tetratricopeptide (TPR) repeat protein
MDLEKKGNAFFEKGNFHEAIQIYETIIKMEPNSGVVLNQLGMCYFNLGNFTEAVSAFKKILRIKNDIPDVYNNLGTCYVNMRQYKMAETVLLISLKLQKKDSIYFALGNLYFYMKEYDKSIIHYEKISEIKTNVSYLYNLGFSYLAQKKFKKGFSLYENRLEDHKIVPQTKEKPRVEIPWILTWDGKRDYKHLLIIYEQGIGDNIQYFRFIIELSRKFPERKITYFCKNTVAHLFKEYPNIHVVLQLTEDIFDYKLYIMSLPYCLELETIQPLTDDYIIREHKKDTYWRERLFQNSKKKIGFVHNGLLSSFIEKNIVLDEWKIFGDLEQCMFICLGKDVTKGSYKKMPNNFHFIEFDKEEPFEDSVSILSQLDLFITVDTGIAHLAGVMNIPTWLLLGYGSDWRWFSKEDTKSLWYSSLELFRMQENKDMKELLSVVKTRLEKW